MNPHLRLSLPERRYGVWRVQITDTDTQEVIRTFYGLRPSDRASAWISDYYQALARQIKEYG